MQVQLNKYNVRSIQSNKKPIIVNHVMSNQVHSAIFNDLLHYFSRYGDPNVQQIITEKPLDTADIFHYHRPNLEVSLRSPSLVTVHHDLDDSDSSLDIKFFLPKYREADAIACLNKTQQKTLTEYGFSEEKLFLIPHGYNNDLLMPDKSRVSRLEKKIECNEKITIGVMSRRYARRVKGEAYLLELAKRLSPEKYNFFLVGKDRTITAVELRSLGFECFAFDLLPYRIVNSLYEKIDILLVPSLFEGGPANIPEALACGVPIFASETGMAKDVIKNKINGLFLSMKPDEDAKLFKVLFNSSSQDFINLTKNMVFHKSDIFTWENIVTKYMNIYKNIYYKFS